MAYSDAARVYVNALDRYEYDEPTLDTARHAYDAGVESMEPALALAKESQKRWQRDALSIQAEAEALKAEVLRLQRVVATRRIIRGMH